MNDWYCRDGQGISGPYNFEELQFLAARQKLAVSMQVRHGSHGNWILLGDLPGILPSTDVALTRTVALAEKTVSFQASGDEPPVDAASQLLPPAAEVPAAATPPPLPPTKRDRSLLFAALAGVGLLLLLLLLWLLFPPSRPSEVASGERSSGVGGGRDREGLDGATRAKRSTDGEAGGAAQDGASATASPDAAPSQAAAATKSPAAAESGATTDESQADAALPPGATPPEEPPVTIDKFTVRVLEPREKSDKKAPPKRDFGGGRSGGSAAAMFRGRDPEKRAELVKRGGGSPESEAAVERGLKWLAKHQHDDGHWGLDDFAGCADCRGQCGSPGQHSDFAATGLGLLPFLAAGYTHKKGDYRETVEKGLQWLQEHQGPDGRLMEGNLYSQAFPSVALCEALGMTGDKTLRDNAQRGIDFIVEAQHAQGGWRYMPKQPGDLSVTGWQVLAVKSGQAAGLRVPKDVMQDVERFVTSCQCDKSGGEYGYTPGGNQGTLNMTAVGLLCRQFTDWPRTREGFAIGANQFLNNLPTPESSNLYYWYYATQVLHHLGGREWKTWNPAMRDTLIKSQLRDGHAAGSWDPRDHWDAAGGRVFVTSLALLTLEVYYRHAPLYGGE